jgi:hypothetical protein
MLENGCFINMPNEEWACKVMINILTNYGFETDENKRPKYIHAMNIY